MAAVDLHQAEAGLRSGRTPFVAATVVRAERPTSAKAGDRALVLPDGRIEGFVGGVCAESTVRLHALRLLDPQRSESDRALLLRLTPDEPGPDDDPEPAVEGRLTVANPCLSGGTLEIFLEAMVRPPLVYVLGDAPVARALVTVGAGLGYEIRVAPDPQAPIPADTAAVVVASHGRDEDAVLLAAVQAGVPYIGLIASRRRGTAVLAGLGLDPDAAERVRTPAGLDIGARTAPEIALSVLAEIVATRPRARMTGEAGSAVPDPAEAVDPVCGMTVAVTADALVLQHAGRQWYFCGSGCRDAFAADPDRYLAGS
ncbi:MAG: XdhC family protein [Sporichthyaceae bacterium]|nr:XdhC family protein [Sporichthyaceae bacterium]